MKKAREFWFYDNGFDEKPVTDIDPEDESYIHVIEKSAYEKLRAHAEAMAESLDWANQRISKIPLQPFDTAEGEADARMRPFARHALEAFRKDFPKDAGRE